MFWMISGKSLRHVKSERLYFTISEITLLNASHFPFGGVWERVLTHHTLKQNSDQ